MIIFMPTLLTKKRWISKKSETKLTINKIGQVLNKAIGHNSHAI